MKMVNLAMRAQLLLVLVVFISLLLGCQMQRTPSKEQCADCIFFDVGFLNNSAISVYGHSEQNHTFSFGNEFSNSKPYIELLEPKNIFFATATLQASSFEYIVHFPIFWTSKLPYASLSQESGIIEAAFLFPHSMNNPLFEIRFERPVFLSDNTISNKLAIEEDALMDTYIIFKPPGIRCSRNFGGNTLQIASVEPFLWNDSYCDQIFSIADYYVRNFGIPFGRYYTITFSKARSYTSLPTGIFVEKYDPSFVSHELFHQFQPENECTQNALYKEGLAVFMQHYSRLRAGIISKKEFDAIFTDYRADLASIPRIKELYFERNLTNFRREHPYEYSLLVYAKGGLIWQMIHQEYDPAEKLFLESFNESNCAKIDRLVYTYEKNLYLQLITDS